LPDTLTVPVSVKVVEAPRLLLVMLVAILAFACVLGWRRGGEEVDGGSMEGRGGSEWPMKTPGHKQLPVGRARMWRGW